jgi:hypothetical protein
VRGQAVFGRYWCAFYSRAQVATSFYRVPQCHLSIGYGLCSFGRRRRVEPWEEVCPLSVSRRVGSGFSLAVFLLFYQHKDLQMAKMSELCKAQTCGRSLAEIVGSNPVRPWMMSLVNVVCCQVKVSSTDRSLVQRNPTKCVCVCVCVCH